MGEITGFLKWGRETPTRRPVPVRLRDWRDAPETVLMPGAGGESLQGVLDRLQALGGDETAA